MPPAPKPLIITLNLTPEQADLVAKGLFLLEEESAAAVKQPHMTRTGREHVKIHQLAVIRLRQSIREILDRSGV